MSISESSVRSLGGSALLFAILQSLCPAFIALNTVRVITGASSLLFAGGTLTAVARFHQDLIRIPMMLFALIGASLNLFVIWQIRRLRNRPAAQWRVSPVSAKKLRSERIQIALALLTYAILLVEFSTHIVIHHHL